jgi:3-isopropylmalate/(R)-2-methylmalate dehydratase large subunit
LTVIGILGTAGGGGYALEFSGEVIKNLTMEERMTVCNMAIEAGSRVGIIEPDEKTFEFLKGNPWLQKVNNGTKQWNIGLL